MTMYSHTNQVIDDCRPHVAPILLISHLSAISLRASPRLSGSVTYQAIEL